MKKTFKINPTGECACCSSYDVTLYCTYIITERLLIALTTCYNDDNDKNRHAVLTALTDTLHNTTTQTCPITSLITDLIETISDYVTDYNLDVLIAEIDSNF